MTMWIIIMWTIIALLGAAFVYLGFRIPRFLSPSVVAEWSPLQSFLCGSLVSLFLIGLITFCIDFVNAIICLLYLAFFWVISDFLFWIISKITSVSFQHYYAGFVAVSACIITLTIGWYLNHHVWQTRYDLTTPKNVPDFKIALFADSHLGTTFDAEGFIQHLKTIQEQKPDIIVIAGDYVDDNTSKDQMIKATQALGKIKTKYGIYFVFGNHDKGYYGAQHRGFSAQELVDTLTRNGIKVLRDEAVLSAPGFYVIGRRDFSEVKEQGATRKSIQELIQELDNTKYMIVLDHQPVEYGEVLLVLE